MNDKIKKNIFIVIIVAIIGAIVKLGNLLYDGRAKERVRRDISKTRDQNKRAREEVREARERIGESINYTESSIRETERSREELERIREDVDQLNRDNIRGREILREIGKQKLD